jgi:hypothetical protein
MKSRGNKKNKSPWFDLTDPAGTAMRFNVRMDKIRQDEEKKIGLIRKKSHQLLIQRNDGIFEYNGNPVTFQNNDAIYAKTFHAIFRSQDVGLGYAPYTKIERHLQAHGVKAKDMPDQGIKRIQNMIRDIYRYSDLPKTVPTGEKLIEILEGKGVILRNPTVG